MMADRSRETSLFICKAALGDNWDAVSETFQDHPELRIEPVNRKLETPLMIAVGTNQSHNFVKNLLSSLSNDSDLIRGAVAAENNKGDTALHYAAKVGNMIDTKLLFLYHPNPAEIALRKNKKGSLLLLYAALFGRKKEKHEFFYYVMGVLLSSMLKYPPGSFYRGDLLSPAIHAGFLDIALELLETYSKKNLRGWHSQRPLEVLASKPELFLSGCTLGFWRRCIYKWLPEVNAQKTTSQQHAQDEEKKRLSNTEY